MASAIVNTFSEACSEFRRLAREYGEDFIRYVFVLGHNAVK